MILNRFKAFFQTAAQVLFTVLLCGLLVFSSVLPAQAATKSSPTKGEANLNSIQKETDDVANTTPRSAEEISEKSKQGTNEVQGGADKEQMISPEETSATTPEQKANNFLQGLTN